MVVRFVGRAEIMAEFLGAVGEDARSSARIVGVSGEPGAGKSRFVEEALGRLARSGRPVTIVRPELSPGMDGMRLLRAFAAKLAIGGAMLAGAISRFQQGGANTQLDESSARALLNALFHEGYDCGVDRRGLIRPKFQRLALVLDDFEMLSEEAVVWLAQTFLPRLDEVRDHLDYVLILVGTRDLSAELEPVSWNSQPMRFLPIEVPALSEAESIELLALFARRSAEAATCHALGEGLPGAMIEMLRYRIRPMDEISALVEGQLGPTASALLAVAGLGFATREGLRLVLGAEAAETAGELLGTSLAVPVFGTLDGGGLWLPGALARLVAEKIGLRLPDVARRAAEVGEMLDGLAVHFPTEADRTMAARLEVFQRFNGTALTACFGADDGRELERFARSHSHAFVETPAGNLRFVADLPPLIERYADALADPARSASHERVTRLWSERALELQTELTGATAAFARLEKDRNELFQELEVARAQAVRQVDESHREWRSRIDEDVVRVGASLLANGAGVSCFWVALFTTNQRLTFIVIGGILIGVGVGTPALKRSRKPLRIDHVGMARRKQDERLAQASGVVNLLEARISGMQMHLAEERRKLERLRAAADEPYA